jgi:hypothetical protein
LPKPAVTAYLDPRPLFFAPYPLSTAMNDSSNTAAGLDQADEDVLTYTVSDEALEAATGTEMGCSRWTDAPLVSLFCC